MGALIVSKGILSTCFYQILQSLPLADKSFSVLNIYPRGHKKCGSGQSNVDICAGSSLATESAAVLSAACPEVIAKTGSFIKKALYVIGLHKPELVILTQNVDSSTSSADLASDGIRIFNRSRTNVLLLPAACKASHSSRIVIGMPTFGSGSTVDISNLSNIVSLADTDITVAVIANPFYPPISRVIPTIREHQSQAIREIHNEQAVNAAMQAEMIANQLAHSKSKPLYIGRTGRLVSELSQVVRSNETALLCMLITSSSKKWLNKTILLELIESTGVPLLLVQTAER